MLDLLNAMYAKAFVACIGWSFIDGHDMVGLIRFVSLERFALHQNEGTLRLLAELVGGTKDRKHSVVLGVHPTLRGAWLQRPV
jgi:hypothetical protein